MPRGTKGKKPIAFRDDPDIMRRLQRVAALMVRKFSVAEIAENLGQPLGTTKRDITRVRTLWREAARESIEDARARSIAQFREVQSAAWDQFAKTKAVAFLRVVAETETRIVDLQGTKAPWRAEILNLLTSGKITLTEIENELGADAARNLFESIGLSVAPIGATEEPS